MTNEPTRVLEFWVHKGRTHVLYSSRFIGQEKLRELHQTKLKEHGQLAVSGITSRMPEC